MKALFYGTLETIGYGALVVAACAALLSLGGCSVNVVVAPHATFAVESDLSQNASQEVQRDNANW